MTSAGLRKMMKDPPCIDQRNVSNFKLEDMRDRNVWISSQHKNVWQSHIIVAFWWSCTSLLY